MFVCGSTPNQPSIFKRINLTLLLDSKAICCISRMIKMNSFLLWQRCNTTDEHQPAKMFAAAKQQRYLPNIILHAHYAITHLLKWWIQQCIYWNGGSYWLTKRLNEPRISLVDRILCCRILHCYLLRLMWCFVKFQFVSASIELEDNHLLAAKGSKTNGNCDGLSK